MKSRMYWGVAILIILLIGVSVFMLMRNRDTEPKVIYKVPSAEVMQQVRKANAVKKPPPGETYGTGYWDGDEWHRTAPPEPESVSVDGEMWTYADLEMKIRQGSSEVRQKAYRLAIAAYPYSELALGARYSLMRYDENGKHVFPDSQTKLEEYKEMLKYHPDSPRLLHDLAQLTEEDAPEESIFYAKEALKYIDLYPPDSAYGRRAYPEKIHHNLGFAYQRVGDYDSALVHLKKTKTLIEANLGRRWDTDYLDNVIIPNIEAIENGNPRYGPPSEEDPLEGIDPSLLDPFNLPPVSDFGDVTMPDFDVPLKPEVMPTDTTSDPAAAEQARAAFEQRQRQEFDAFVRWMAERERAESPTNLEDFLMREMAKQMQAGESQFTPDQLIQAFQMWQRRGTDDDIRHPRAVDPEVAKELSRRRTERSRRTSKQRSYSDDEK